MSHEPSRRARPGVASEGTRTSRSSQVPRSAARGTIRAAWRVAREGVTTRVRGEWDFWGTMAGGLLGRGGRWGDLRPVVEIPFGAVGRPEAERGPLGFARGRLFDCG